PANSSHPRRKSMLQSLLQRAREARAAELGDGEGLEEGFTLIELMVVLLIIAILLAIAIPTFLGVTNSASDRASQSNLTTALTEAKAIYQNSSNYLDSSNNPLAPTNSPFSTNAPEFTWTNGGCSGSGNCMSMQVIDVNVPNDGQGLILADFSQKDGVCWYTVDLENAPAVMVDANYPNATAGVPFETATVQPKVGGTLMANAGVYYAKKSSATATTCNAGWAADPASGTTPHVFSWGTSYASPGAAD
ncbi:MAG TPA: prepilin-type N-terminal cleavage/methylation domain-containing protein, partial [Acidimicrobiales bacterium]|nr:prepilin-type N-terminal cleavage/methylation domain-containing protein [Acidimicrobiales bacterium]